MQYKNDGMKYRRSKCLFFIVSLISDSIELLEIGEEIQSDPWSTLDIQEF